MPSGERSVSSDGQLLSGQVDYYRERAEEYDDWFYRRDRYDFGDDHRKRWFSEAQEVRTALAKAVPCGNVLELACGTGIWTRELVRSASRVVAVDTSPEVVEVNRRRLGEAPGEASVEYVIADIFEWQPTTTFDLVFFGFWLSHVPPSRFESFWTKVRTSLRPGASVFFLDSADRREYGRLDTKPREDDSWVVRRNLKDGREFDIVKIFYEPTALTDRLRALGWEGRVQQTEQFFIYGQFR